jgi:hypothetical protein
MGKSRLRGLEAPLGADGNLVKLGRTAKEVGASAHVVDGGRFRSTPEVGRRFRLRDVQNAGELNNAVGTEFHGLLLVLACSLYVRNQTMSSCLCMYEKKHNTSLNTDAGDKAACAG